MMLAAESVSKSYRGTRVLRDCSLRVESGACALIRGPSGEGKSTFLRILALLESADSGRVQHGTSTFDASASTNGPAYPFLTVVFQQLFLWPNLSMRDNLALVLNHDLRSPLPAAAMETMERFQIRGTLNKLPHECSLGQRQRLAIVRALLSDARFLLLDEPSSALDKANRAILLKVLKEELAKDRGILLVSHDDGSYDEIVTEVFDMEDGSIQRTS